jgi:hypothetical protein
MKRSIQAAALMLALSPAVVSWIAFWAPPATAQMPIPLSATGLSINYVEPTDPAHRAIYDRLRKRQVLEQYKEFMSPLQLNRALSVALRGCDGKANAWYSNGKITYCYEMVAEIESVVAKTAPLPGFKLEDAIVGAFVQILLHETSHAVFDLLDVPVFGREEDAADALAEFVLLQFGDKVARRTLTGTAFIWRAFELAENRNRTLEDYADEHGTHGQRFYNALCIAYGSDLVEGTRTFNDFIENNLLPEGRRGQCANEYRHARISFERLIMPHVDKALMAKVRTTEWLKPEDGMDLLPPSGPPPGGPPGMPMPPSSRPGGTK